MYDVYGVICGTYEESCIVAGIETPAQLADEARYWAAIEAVEEQDAMEARGGPRVRAAYEATSSDIPF